jgi:hypothetical protein
MIRLSFSVLVLITLGLIQGCSSVINGQTQKISINSNVQGAEVTIDGVNVGRTPLINARIKRKDTSYLIVKKEGYRDYQQTLQTKLDPWFWGNIIIGGVLGSTTDTVAGTTHLLDPDTLFIQLEPSTGSSLQISKPEDQELRTYVLNTYSQLMKDIKNGKGDYLKSLLKIMKTPSNQIEGTIKKLKSMSELYDTVNEFAEEVVKLNARK